MAFCCVTSGVTAAISSGKVARTRCGPIRLRGMSKRCLVIQRLATDLLGRSAVHCPFLRSEGSVLLNSAMEPSTPLRVVAAHRQGRR